MNLNGSRKNLFKSRVRIYQILFYKKHKPTKFVIKRFERKYESTTYNKLIIDLFSFLITPM